MVVIGLALVVALGGAPKKTQLKIEIKPETAVLFVDGKRKGTGAKLHVFTVTPGRHLLKVVNKKDEHQEMVIVKKGEVTSWQWA